MLVTGYFVISYINFNDKGIEQEYFLRSFYRTRNNDGFISFGNFTNAVICVDDIYYYVNEIRYENGIFSMFNRDNNEIYYIGTIEKDILFSSSFNRYFYNANIERKDNTK